MLQMQEHLTKETKWRQTRHKQEQMETNKQQISNEQKSPRIQESH